MIKLLDLLKEASPFVPRGSKEERENDFKRVTQNKIQEYIKNGMKGYLDLSNSPITSLPSSLTKVGGNLDLSNSLITSLPTSLTKVGGYLNLYGTPITSLPNNLTVGRDLNLNNCKEITKLPDNLTVKRDLYLYDTPITSLPSNLTVGGDLTLLDTPLSKNHSEAEIRAMVPNFKGYIRM